MDITDYLYSFYPKGIKDSFSEEYLNSKPYRNLTDRIEYAKNHIEVNQISSELTSLIDSIKYDEMNLNNLTNFNFLDRCFNFQFKDKVIDNVVRAVYCNISVLMPFYTIYFLERDYANFKMGEKMTSDFFTYDLEVFPSEYEDLRNAISNVLNSKNLFQLDNEYLSDLVPEIGFEEVSYGTMSIFNCLFLNEPYMIPPQNNFNNEK